MTFQDNPVLGRFTEAARAMDERHEELKAAYQHIERIEAALAECLEYFKDRYDVVDGPEGGQWPNTEMQLGCMIDETLHGPGGF